jgi:riboflavin synthase
MFTGITQGVFSIATVDRKPDLTTYAVELDAARTEGLQIGASVSIDGVCQTVTAISGHSVSFEAIRETLDLSTLDALKVGLEVAVERSARVGDEVGGHDVAGHVNGTGLIAKVHSDGHIFDLTIEVPGEWMNAIFDKGFIAVDGSSLTVSDAIMYEGKGRFTVHLIPETLRLTNLGNKRKGDRVNIELDARTVAIVKTVERILDAKGHSTST